VKGKIILKQGDITSEHVDAIVNAANMKLMGGGGVDGAIHAAGGPQILEECRSHIDAYGECPTGDAVMTTGGDLSSRYVIHTVGPVWHGGRFGENQLLHDCYTNSLLMAQHHNLHSVAFPNISTGVYGYPKQEAAIVAIEAVENFMQTHEGVDEVVFVCYSDDNYKLYKEILESKKMI
jgi:O-acetyl-ADP-ribose deacetylase (regulator of RNase III)